MMVKKKMIFFEANALDTPRLTSGEEQRTIKQQLESSSTKHTLELVVIPAARPVDWLDELTKQHASIVHFSGHGTPGGSLHHTGDDKQTHLVSPAALQEIFKNLKKEIKLVFFNVCSSKALAESIAEEIDCVIGMNGPIKDESALAFSNTFYQRIFDKKSVEEAFKQGKMAIKVKQLDGEQMPALFVRPGVDAAKVYLSGPLSREQAEQISLFYCYAPNDEKFCHELETHLSGMRRQGIIKGWYAKNLQGGLETPKETQDALDAADIVLLIVSPDFMAYDPLYEHQLVEIQCRREAGTARVVPIIVRPTDGWEQSNFGPLFALPREKKPVSAWSQREEALYSITKDIRQIVEIIKKQSN